MKLKGVGNDAGGKDANEEKLSVTSDTAPDGFSDNENLKNNEKLKNNAIHQIFEKSGEHPLQAHLPVLYNLGLCYENLSRKI